MYTLEELYELDEEGKKIALEYIDRSDKIAYGKTRRWLGRLSNAKKTLLTKLLPGVYGFEEYLTMDLEDLDESFDSAINSIIEEMEDCSDYGMTFRSCSINDTPVDMLNEDYTVRMRKMTGVEEGCAWGIGLPYYNLPMAINDLTSCYHGLVELYAKHKMTPIGHLAYASDDADDKSKRLCKVWEDSVNVMNMNELYNYDDYKMVSCFAFKDKCELRVGSSPGHKTSVDVKNGRVRYYDTDYYVNAIVRKLFEDKGLKCSLIDEEMMIETGEDKGVVCTGLSDENIDDAAKILSATTSMDLRISAIKDVETSENIAKEPIYWNFAWERELRRAKREKKIGNEEGYKMHKDKGERIKECVENAPENPEFYPSYAADVEYCAIKAKLDL